MTVSLSTLTTRLQNDVPARDGIPSSGQYDEAVKEAVRDYSRRNPLRKLTTLSIVDGTATYTLPDDFLFVISLESLASPDDVLITGNGLIPVDATYDERYYITGNEITFDPEPEYTVDRDLWYAAQHVLDGSDNYPDMTDRKADILMVKAQAIAIRMQANKAAQQAWTYTQGDVKVDKREQVKQMRAQAEVLEEEYLRKVDSDIGSVGSRATYSPSGK